MSLTAKPKPDLTAQASILDQETIDLVVKGIRNMVDGFGDLLEAYPVDLEGTIRFMAVARKCEMTREEMGMSIKEIAKELKVPMKNLKSIEEGSIAEIDGQLLNEYVQALGIENWFAKWRKANGELYKKLKAQQTAQRKAR